MRLPIVGDSPAATAAGDESWPDPLAAPLVVLFDVRGGQRDAALLTALRGAGLDERALLALEGAERRSALPPGLGPGESIRGHGAALVRAVQAAHAEAAPDRRPRLGLGAAVARAFTAPLVVRIDGDTPRTAQAALARGVPAHLTLRDGDLAILRPLLGEFLEF